MSDPTPPSEADYDEAARLYDEAYGDPRTEAIELIGRALAARTERATAAERERDDLREKLAETEARVATLEAAVAAWSQAHDGCDSNVQDAMDESLRALLSAPEEPCATCGGSGQVGVMRIETVYDENGDPGGEWVGDSAPCPACRKEGA